MDGQANVKTIDFLGEDIDPSRDALLKTFKLDGKTFVTRKDVWVVNGGVHDILQTGFGGRRNYDQLGTPWARVCFRLLHGCGARRAGVAY